MNLLYDYPHTYNKLQLLVKYDLQLILLLCREGN